MYVEQPKKGRWKEKEEENGIRREVTSGSTGELSVEKNPRGQVLAGTVYSSSLR